MLYSIVKLMGVPDCSLVPVEGGGRVGLRSGLSMPAQVQQVYFPRSSLMTVAPSGRVAFPLSISAQRRRISSSHSGETV
jgi:hypothetical protein